jgi:hypothetical protein
VSITFVETVQPLPSSLALAAAPPTPGVPMFVEFRVRVPLEVFALLMLSRTLSRLEEFSLVPANAVEKSTVPDVLSKQPDGKFSRLVQLSQVFIRLVADLQSI